MEKNMVKKIVTMLMLMLMTLIIVVSPVSAKGKGKTKMIAITGKVATKRKRRSGMHLSQGVGEKLYSDDAPVVKVESDGNAKARVAEMISKRVTHFEIMNIDSETRDWVKRSDEEEIQDSLSRDGYLNDMNSPLPLRFAQWKWYLYRNP